MQTQAMTNKIYTADRDRDFHFRVKDPGSAATHFIGFVAAVLMTPVLLVHAAGNGADFMTMIGMSVFMISMILLYGASTSYHSFDISEKANLRLKRLDHMMIFVLIAGSYTPVCLTVLRHGVGIRLLAIVWGLAIVGMIFKLLWVTCPKWVSSVIYIGMGWVCILAMPQLLAGLSFGAFMWLLAGGLFYTLGGVIYAMKFPVFHNRFRYFGYRKGKHFFSIHLYVGFLCFGIIFVTDLISALQGKCPAFFSNGMGYLCISATLFCFQHNCSCAVPEKDAGTTVRPVR